MTERFVNTKEAAVFLGYHPNTIRLWVAEAKVLPTGFPFYQIPPKGRLKYKLSELAQWMKSKRIEGEIKTWKTSR